MFVWIYLAWIYANIHNATSQQTWYTMKVVNKIIYAIKGLNVKLLNYVKY